MNSENILYCSDIEKIVGSNFWNKSMGCCQSCHEDDDSGYYSLYDLEDTGEYTNICCAAKRIWNDWKKINE